MRPISARIWAWPALLAGCSFGPPNLGPILHHPPGKGNSTVLEAGYETMNRYQGHHAWAPEEADGEMEFFDIRNSITGVLHHDVFLVSLYLKNLLIQPGAGIGMRTDSFYGMAFLELTLVPKHLLRPGSAHLAWQMGWKPLRWMVATYDIFQIEFNDMEKSAYGWDSFHTEEAWASRATICLGIPGMPLSYNLSILFAHGVDEVGLGGALSLSIR